MPPRRAEIITGETCLECGACCVAQVDQAAYCNITPEDERRLGRKFVRLHVVYPPPLDAFVALLNGTEPSHGAIRTRHVVHASGPLAGVRTCQCVALEGTVLERAKCGIYPKRPEACRLAVQPGDAWCRELRRRVRAMARPRKARKTRRKSETR